MRAENYITKGIFFRSKSEKKNLLESLEDIQLIIQIYFTNKGYQYTGPSKHFFKYFEQEFFLTNKPKVSKLKALFGQSPINQVRKQHMSSLKNTRKELVGEARIFVYPGDYLNHEGFYIEAVVKPIKYLKIVQLNESPEISAQEYSFITTESKEFLENFCKANFFVTVKEPSQLNVYAKTEISEKLIRYGFEKIAGILEEGKKKLELAEDREAINYLSKTIEHFCVELLKKLNEQPLPLQKPERNIEILKNKNYISSKMSDVIKKSVFESVYRVLVDFDHKKDHLDLFDLMHMFNITEQTIDYLIEKIWRYKIKCSIKT